MSNLSSLKQTGRKPFLIIVNGPSAVGKTTLSRRLAEDLQTPILYKDQLYETLFDAWEGENLSERSVLERARVRLLHTLALMQLEAQVSFIIEGSFFPAQQALELFHHLHQQSAFTPVHIDCVADGTVTLQRFLARMDSTERHRCHYQNDHTFAAEHSDIILQGDFPFFHLEGPTITVDLTNPDQPDYQRLLDNLSACLNVEKIV